MCPLVLAYSALTLCLSELKIIIEQPYINPVTGVCSVIINGKEFSIPCTPEPQDQE